MERHSSKWLLCSAILSISLLTTMAGAAIAPALDVIQAHFAGMNPLWVQMLVSVPALFIILTTFIFPRLTRRYTTRTLVLGALVVYILSGSMAFLFNNIWLIMVLRAMLGVSVGVLMPLSTGLLYHYFSQKHHARLMGISSSMNYLGAVVATLLTGLLSHIQWNYSFLVYLGGLVALIPCALFLPADRIGGQDNRRAGMKTPQKSEIFEGPVKPAPTDDGIQRAGMKPAPTGDGIRRAGIKTPQKSEIFGGPVKPAPTGQINEPGGTYLIILMFLSMGTFFIYPTNYAIQCAGDGYLVPAPLITVLMALMDCIAMLIGMFFADIMGWMKNKIRFAAPVAFLLGYGALALFPQMEASIAGSVLVGIGSGLAIPLVFASVGRLYGPAAAPRLMPRLSAALYAAQFLVPFIVSLLSLPLGSLPHQPYIVALLMAVMLLIVSSRLGKRNFVQNSTNKEGND